MIRRAVSAISILAALSVLTGCASVAGDREGYASSGLNVVCQADRGGHSLLELTLDPIHDYAWLGSVMAEGTAVHLDRIGVLPEGQGIRPGEARPVKKQLEKILLEAVDDTSPFASTQQDGLRTQPDTGPYNVLLDIRWTAGAAKLEALRLHWSSGEPAWLQHLEVTVSRKNCD